MSIRLTRRFLLALLVALIAAALFKVSFLRETLEGYTFPAVVAGTILALSLVSLAREALDLCVDDYQPFPFFRQLPAIVMMGGAAMLIDVIGMYTSAFLVLALISYWYSPQPNGLRRLMNSVALGLGFGFVMYLLFSVMLNVQMPRGMLI